MFQQILDIQVNIDVDLQIVFHLISLDKEISRHWLKDFLKRNKKDLKMVKEKKMEKSRRDGFSEDVRSGWFKNLKEVLMKNDILYKPQQIWNVDESGFNDETQSK